VGRGSAPLPDLRARRGLPVHPDNDDLCSVDPDFVPAEFSLESPLDRWGVLVDLGLVSEGHVDAACTLRHSSDPLAAPSIIRAHALTYRRVELTATLLGIAGQGREPRWGKGVMAHYGESWLIPRERVMMFPEACFLVRAAA